MTVQFSREAACFTFTCEWGCWDFDFESAQEAADALAAHQCKHGVFEVS
jgi:hypothetical protein